MLISTSTGICTSVLHRSEKHFTCEEALVQIARAGFQAADLCFVAYGRPGMPMSAPDWRTWVRRQKELAETLGLETNQGHAHYYPAAESYRYTQEDWQAAEALIRRDIEAAGICAIPWLVIHPDSHLKDGNYSRRLSLQKEYERFSRLGDLAARWNVGIAIENMIAGSSAGRFGCTYEDLMDLLNLLKDDERFGICWDTGHANLNQSDQPSAIRAMGKRLRCLHVNDNYCRGSDDHTLPFLGTIAWEPIMDALNESGYQGDFTYEIHRFTDGFSPQIHPQALHFARLTAEHLLTMMNDI